MNKKGLIAKSCALILVLTLLCLCFGCGKKADQPASDPSQKSVVVTIYPIYDWIREIIGDRSQNFELTWLLDGGVDLHSFQPTPKDMVRIADCDLFVYVGGESDEWVEDALKESPNPDRVVINLMDALGEKKVTEETVEGMTEKKHLFSEETAEAEEEADEHIWLSLKNADVLCQVLENALSRIDPAHQNVFAQNSSAYCAELAALDDAYRQTAEQATVKTLLFADRFPFRYLVEDYGLNYYAAFSGCSAESEAAFETIIFLAEQIDRLGLKTVLTLEKSDQSMAQTIIGITKERNARIAAMDSMQSVTAADLQEGISYLEIMKANLAVLKTALGM